MSNEKKIKAEELSDEQLNEASGGSALALDKEEKRCNKCGEKLPDNYLGFLCKKCKGSASDIAGIQFPDPR